MSVFKIAVIWLDSSCRAHMLDTNWEALSLNTGTIAGFVLLGLFREYVFLERSSSLKNDLVIETNMKIQTFSSD